MNNIVAISLARYTKDREEKVIKTIANKYNIDENLIQTIINTTRNNSMDLDNTSLDNLISNNITKLINMLKFRTTRYPNFEVMSKDLDIPIIYYYAYSDLSKVNVSIFQTTIRKEIELKKHQIDKSLIKASVQEQFIYRLCRTLGITTATYRHNKSRYSITLKGNIVYGPLEVERIYGITHKGLSEMLLKTIISDSKNTERLESLISELVQKLTYKNKLYKSKSDMAKRLGVKALRMNYLFKKDAENFHKALDKEIESGDVLSANTYS